MLFCLFVVLYFYPLFCLLFYNPVVTKFVMWKERGQGWLVETRVIYCFFNIKLNRLRTLHLVCSSTLTVVSAFTLCVRSGYPLSPVHAPESPLRLSLSSPRSPVVFIWSLHANYCNQTQVFLILHLTHLLTAVC